MKIVVMHPKGDYQIIQPGFSWLTFLFGFFVPLSRKDYTWAGIIFLIKLGAVFAFTYIIEKQYSYGLSYVVNLFFAFTYNHLHAKSLAKKGYMGINPEMDQLFLNYVK